MKERTESRRHTVQCVIAITASFVLLAGLGCKSSKVKSSEQAAEGADQQQAAASSSNEGGSGPGIDLNCVIDHIQNPKESFHYSYKKTDDSPVIQEADITPQTIDGSFTNGTFSNTVHGVRSDSDGWRQAWAGMTGVAGMAGTVALINHSSAMVMEGKASVNGYDTIHYSIDTARGNYAELGLYKSTLGNGGFEKGEAWVTSEGCPVKLTLASETHMNNGQVDKTLYELSMVKK